MSLHERAAIRLVHMLVTCAAAIQAGDYGAAATYLIEARTILVNTIPTSSGIGRVTIHFATALAHRLNSASPNSSLSPSSSSPSANNHASEQYRQFYDQVPHLKFAHFTANQAFLEAFRGHDRVHIIDLAIMCGLQWLSLIKAFSIWPGGPPSIRITGVGPTHTGSRDELREVGLMLTEHARVLNVPFSFHIVTGDNLEGLKPWMFHLVQGEAIAVNSICQLHRLLVDPDAASTSLPPPIDTVLGWITSMRPKVFTVVEQEADHNKPTLVERFTNALFYYGAMFDSMEAVATRSRTGAAERGAEVHLKREIFNIVCNEGSSRVERHETLPRWRARLRRAGLAQVPLRPNNLRHASMLLHDLSGDGYHVMERGDGLMLAWHNNPLFSVSVWHIMEEELEDNKNKVVRRSSTHLATAGAMLSMQ
ncbi:DELLA protein GAI1 [Brachypodium distachyon]|nr:DELLA protein GAI1 [Brachypodium distachyon]|eukprot:XP_010229736.1 DELLA protein GAI1 [Brachypodium distachyon]